MFHRVLLSLTFLLTFSLVSCGGNFGSLPESGNEIPGPAPILLGSNCQVFPADSPWNMDISQLDAHPISDAYINQILNNGSRTRLHPDLGPLPWQIK